MSRSLYQDIPLQAIPFLSLDVLLSQELTQKDSNTSISISSVKCELYRDNNYPVLYTPFNISRTLHIIPINED